MTIEKGSSQRSCNSGGSFRMAVAYAAMIFGFALIFGSGAYLYSRARSGTDSIQFSYSIPAENINAHLGKTVGSTATLNNTGSQPIPFELRPPDVLQFASLYPGSHLNPMYWAEPEWAGSRPYGGPTIPDDFVPVDSKDLFHDFFPDADAERIRIPSINVDSSVLELEIIDLGDQQAYQTPNNTVGHIPTTSAPGQQGSGWFFAHLESHVEGEGNIFRHLPDITDLIKRDPVDVYLQTDEAEFIYRVTDTRQIHKDELSLTNSAHAQIVLVTCWPALVYDQRIVVNATLVAYRPI